MKHGSMNKLVGALVILTALTGLQPCCFAEGGSTADPVKLDPCTLLNAAEISAIVGQLVADGKLNPNANPVLGAPCEFKVGDYGTCSLWIGRNQTNTCDVTKSELEKRKVKTSDAPGLGDCAFFADMGYGMQQLNTWKGADYLIITMMVTGVAEDQQKVMADKLMKLVLAKL